MNAGTIADTMRYQKLDLNLLIALRHLLIEKSVTRAAQALHVTQPAMSGMLARLREYFEDPLVIQVGRRMELTALAAGLMTPVQELLVQIDATLGIRSEFDPTTTRRRFSVVASDYVVQVLMVDVLRDVHMLAPGARVDLWIPGTSSVAQLEEGEVDLLIAPESLSSSSHAAVTLFEDGFCALVDAELGPATEGLTLAQFLELPHVVYESSGRPFFDRWFDRTHGELRHVKVTTHGFQSLSHLVAGTRRVATLPTRMASQLSSALPVRQLQLNFAVPPLVEVLQWHRLRESDPGLLWLRSLITRRAQELSAGLPLS